jgi:small subunit ribosomal protein S20
VYIAPTLTGGNLPPKKTGRKKSGIKAHRQSIQRNLRNKAVKSAIKTWIKKVESASQPGEAKTALTKAFSVVDKAAKRKVIHRNQASRIKARLGRLVSKLEPAKPA